MSDRDRNRNDETSPDGRRSSRSDSSRDKRVSDGSGRNSRTGKRGSDGRRRKGSSDTGRSRSSSSSNGRTRTSASDDDQIRVRGGVGYQDDDRAQRSSDYGRTSRSSDSQGSRRDSSSSRRRETDVYVRDGRSSRSGYARGDSQRRYRGEPRGGRGRSGGGRNGGSGGGFVDAIERDMFEDGAASKRNSFVLIVFIVMIAYIFVWLFLLQVVDVFGYADDAANTRTAEETVYAKRGTIYDRNGNILAMSVEATTVVCNPTQIVDAEATAQELADILGGEAEDYIDALTADSSFAYIVRQADTSVEDEITARKKELKQGMVSYVVSESGIDAETTSLGSSSLLFAYVACGVDIVWQVSEGTLTVPDSTALDGVYCQDDMKRVYPYGSVGGQVIGAVDTDGNGISGLELVYDEILKGTNGYQTVERSRTGMDIPGGTTVVVEAVNGTDIMISIDIELQAVAEETLAEQTESSGAESGQIVVIDGDTGEIYVACSTPSFDPSDTSSSEAGSESLKTVTSSYEPGSIFKPVTAAILLELGLADPDEEITVPSSRTFGQWTIEDSHEHGTVVMTFKEIIEQSSNIGISLLEERIGSETFYEYITMLGFGSTTGIDYWTELSGSLADYTEWSEVQEANISFGQGLTVTTTQMAAFYGMLAADGVYSQPHFLIGYPTTGETVEYESEQLLSESTCETLDDMLSGVVTDGTGTLAAIDGYTVAGKTGTSQKIEDDGTYSDSAYMISFDGYLPYTDSSLACCVTFDNPSTAAAMMTFSEVMEAATEMYRIVETTE